MVYEPIWKQRMRIINITTMICTRRAFFFPCFRNVFHTMLHLSVLAIRLVRLLFLSCDFLFLHTLFLGDFYTVRWGIETCLVQMSFARVCFVKLYLPLPHVHTHISHCHFAFVLTRAYTIGIFSFFKQIMNNCFVFEYSTRLQRQDRPLLASDLHDTTVLARL